MARFTIYASASAAAFMIFAMTGGIRASEQAVKAEEQATASAVPGAEAQIPFANSGNIRDWRADGREALYVQDSRGRWYHASLMGSCIDLTSANQIAFLTRGPDLLDKYSAIAVRGQRCQFSSLVTSAGPPKRETAIGPAKG